MRHGISFDRQEFAGLVKLSERTCGADGCSAPPTHTYSMVTPIGSGATRRVVHEVVWCCDEHLPGLVVLAETRLAEESDAFTGWIQDLAPTSCLICDQAATHVAFAARDYGRARRLEALTLCTEHARQASRRLSG